MRNVLSMCLVVLGLPALAGTAFSLTPTPSPTCTPCTGCYIDALFLGASMSRFDANTVISYQGKARLCSVPSPECGQVFGRLEFLQLPAKNVVESFDLNFDVSADCATEIHTYEGNMIWCPQGAFPWGDYQAVFILETSAQACAQAQSVYVRYEPLTAETPTPTTTETPTRTPTRTPAFFTPTRTPTQCPYLSSGTWNDGITVWPQVFDSQVTIRTFAGTYGGMAWGWPDGSAEVAIASVTAQQYVAFLPLTPVYQANECSLFGFFDSCFTWAPGPTHPAGRYVFEFYVERLGFPELLSSAQAIYQVPALTATPTPTPEPPSLRTVVLNHLRPSLVGNGQVVEMSFVANGATITPAPECTPGIPEGYRFINTARVDWWDDTHKGKDHLLTMAFEYGLDCDYFFTNYFGKASPFLRTVFRSENLNYDPPRIFRDQQGNLLPDMVQLTTICRQDQWYVSFDGAGIDLEVTYQGGPPATDTPTSTPTMTPTPSLTPTKTPTKTPTLTPTLCPCTGCSATAQSVTAANPDFLDSVRIRYRANGYECYSPHVCSPTAALEFWQAGGVMVYSSILAGVTERQCTLEYTWDGNFIWTPEAGLPPGDYEVRLVADNHYGSVDTKTVLLHYQGGPTATPTPSATGTLTPTPTPTYYCPQGLDGAVLQAGPDPFTESLDINWSFQATVWEYGYYCAVYAFVDVYPPGTSVRSGGAALASFSGPRSPTYCNHCSGHDRFLWTPEPGSPAGLYRVEMTVLFSGSVLGTRTASVTYDPPVPTPTPTVTPHTFLHILAAGYLTTSLDRQGGLLNFIVLTRDAGTSDRVEFYYRGNPLGLPLQGGGEVYTFSMTFNGPLPATRMLLETGINGEVKWPYLEVE